MKNTNSITWKHLVLLAVFLALSAGELLAQGTPPASPWENAIQVLETAFTGPIARGLSLIAIVVGGLMFAFGEGGSKKALAGIVFGLGMAMGAANFLGWLF
ncbi:MAG: TrbC/VirB2 family protein [Acidobacteriota bacterium]|nr:TrbC/VirB2 family protein [Acidobacteriota bacterium]MDE2755703.1 TrbC/VirB2 family protein [Acidobacteriota bacterium]